MKKYLMIKNTIIALLVTVIYYKWLVEGISVWKMIIACITIFISMFSLLRLADKCYIKEMKKSA